MNSTTLLTGSGVASLTLALSYVGKMILDWRRAPTHTRSSAAVLDAQGANAILATSLSGLQAENARLAARVKMLEDENDAKDAKIEELEEALGLLRVQLSAIADELKSLKSKR